MIIFKTESRESASLCVLITAPIMELKHCFKDIFCYTTAHGKVEDLNSLNLDSDITSSVAATYDAK